MKFLFLHQFNSTRIIEWENIIYYINILHIMQNVKSVHFISKYQTLLVYVNIHTQQPVPR